MAKATFACATPIRTFVVGELSADGASGPPAPSSLDYPTPLPPMQALRHALALWQSTPSVWVGGGEGGASWNSLVDITSTIV